ncbi:MAG TPA: cyclic nucleotide-binding domain-containing protein [Xanthobacteraceae bacterium]|nr:cyclic nucleotide-binding domain-containing protein [Xanthobacteraceae bacterium]
MTIEDDIAFLERVPILHRLGAGALRIIAIGAESYAVEAGQLLFPAGETADCAYIVQQGSFTLKPERPGDGDVVAEPGTLLGEAALLAETRRPVSATAREDSTVLRISRAMFLKMLESYPDAAQRLRELIASRADQWTREMENVRTALTRGTGPR